MSIKKRTLINDNRLDGDSKYYLSHQNIFHSNARLVQNKIDKIALFYNKHVSPLHVTIVSEGWLTAEVPDCCLRIPEYNNIRKDQKE